MQTGSPPKPHSLGLAGAEAGGRDKAAEKAHPVGGSGWAEGPCAKQEAESEPLPVTSRVAAAAVGLLCLPAPTPPSGAEVGPHPVPECTCVSVPLADTCSLPPLPQLFLPAVASL